MNPSCADRDVRGRANTVPRSWWRPALCVQRRFHTFSPDPFPRMTTIGFLSLGQTFVPEKRKKLVSFQQSQKGLTKVIAESHSEHLWVQPDRTFRMDGAGKIPFQQTL